MIDWTKEESTKNCVLKKDIFLIKIVLVKLVRFQY